MVELQTNTYADDSMKKTIMSSVGEKWREWKSKAKKLGYKPFKMTVTG